MKICLFCTKFFFGDEWACPTCGYKPVQMNGIEVHAAELANAGGGFKPEYFAELAKLESSNFWFQSRNKMILWALDRYKPDAKSFLEVGCGTGFVLSGIAKAHPDMSLNGSEIFLEGLTHAAARVKSAKFMQMDARNVPFADEFDAIGAFDVLEHIEEDQTVLVQLYRALKPDGVLLLTVPQHPWLWSASDEYACHVRRYTRTDIEAKLREAGFQLLRSTSFVTTLLPAMMLSRKAQKKNNQAYDPTSEFKMNPFLNKLFYNLIIFELAGIRLGFNYPVGGSRLVVAKKTSNYLP